MRISNTNERLRGQSVCTRCDFLPQFSPRGSNFSSLSPSSRSPTRVLPSYYPQLLITSAVHTSLISLSVYFCPVWVSPSGHGRYCCQRPSSCCCMPHVTASHYPLESVLPCALSTRTWTYRFIRWIARSLSDARLYLARSYHMQPTAKKLCKWTTHATLYSVCSKQLSSFQLRCFFLSFCIRSHASLFYVYDMCAVVSGFSYSSVEYIMCFLSDQTSISAFMHLFWRGPRKRKVPCIYLL